MERKTLLETNNKKYEKRRLRSMEIAKMGKVNMEDLYD